MAQSTVDANIPGWKYKLEALLRSGELPRVINFNYGYHGIDCLDLATRYGYLPAMERDSNECTFTRDLSSKSKKDDEE